MRLIATLAAMLALLAGGLRAQEEEKKNTVLKGILAHDPKLEGGVWTLKFEGKVYDLHGDLSKCRSGDKVVIEGRACPDRACFHMVGVVFTVTTVKTIEE